MNFNHFLKDIKCELFNIVWPDKNDVIKLFFIFIFLLTIISFFFFYVDYILYKLINFILFFNII